MKKSALTLVAFAFGIGVSFAQTAPQTEDKPAVNTEETVTTDNMSNTEAATSLKSIQIEELPAAVQETLKGDQFKDYQVVSVAEVQGQEDAAAGKFYQAALAQNGATEPSLIVLFDEKGKAIAQEEATTEK